MSSKSKTEEILDFAPNVFVNKAFHPNDKILSALNERDREKEPCNQGIRHALYAHGTALPGRCKKIKGKLRCNCGLLTARKKMCATQLFICKVFSTTVHCMEMANI